MWRLGGSVEGIRRNVVNTSIQWVNEKVSQQLLMLNTHFLGDRDLPRAVVDVEAIIRSYER